MTPVFSVIRISLESGGNAFKSCLNRASMYLSKNPIKQARSHGLIAAAFHSGSCAIVWKAAPQRRTLTASLMTFFGMNRPLYQIVAADYADYADLGRRR